MMSMDEREMEAYSILRGDNELGALACYPDTCEEEIAPLRAAGFTVQPMEMSEGDLQSLEADCTEDSHEACDIALGAGWMRDLAEDTGTDASELTALIETGYSDKQQVLDVMETVRQRLPDTATVAGDEIHVREEAERAMRVAREGYQVLDEE